MTRQRGALAPVLAVLAASQPGSAMAEDAPTIAAGICAPCHGENGNSLIPMFPKIAGLSEGYIVKQLRDFASGRRKSEIMAPVVAALKPEEFTPLGAYFGAQRRKAGAPENIRVVGLGKLIFYDGNEESGVPACVGCHQAEGAGHGIYPAIGGQHILYVKQQMKNFAVGERSNDSGRFMRTTAKRMTEEEIQAVAEYLVGLGAK